MLLDVAKFQDVSLSPGTVVLVRTGWLEQYLALNARERASLAGTERSGFTSPGLDPGKSMAEFLWDNEVPAVASDNVALEALPIIGAEGYLHRRLIPLLGILIGELWDFAKLAKACREYERYEFLVTSAPLQITGGAGSPSNAFAYF
jgi:kynurenine formamidase